MMMCYNFDMNKYVRLFCCLIIATTAILPAVHAAAAEAVSVASLSSIVITLDPPIIAGTNRAADLYGLMQNVLTSSDSDISRRIKQSGAMWSASYSLCGIQFAIYHFDNPDTASEICTDLLERLASLATKLEQKSLKRADFAEYIHSFLPAANSDHAPVSLYLSYDMSPYSEALRSAAEQLTPLFIDKPVQNIGKLMLPEVLPTAYTVFFWPESTDAAFFTAKYFGEKFISEAGLEQLLKYEIIYTPRALWLVVYLSGTENLLAENMQKFRKIIHTNMNDAPTTEWPLFCQSLRDIIDDDQRDLAKNALFNSWQQHWQTSFRDMTDEKQPVPPQKRFTGFAMPETYQHQLSFSEGLFPDFAAASQGKDDSSCDITIALTARVHQLLDSIHQHLSQTTQPVTLTLVRHPDLLKITFHCDIKEIEGHLARIRNGIYNHLVEKGLVSNPVSSLNIGIAGVSGLPPFELRGLLQKGWLPTRKHRTPTSPIDPAAVLRLSETTPEQVEQRWKMYMASQRGCSELLAMIAVAGHRIKNFSLPR